MATEELPQMIIGFGQSTKLDAVTVAMYQDPVINDWIVWGANSTTFRLELLRSAHIDLYRQYHPYQLSMIFGFRKCTEYINSMYSHPLLGATPIIVQMLRDSGYTVLPDKQADDIDPNQLDTALRERPDLYQRREMKEDG